MGTDFSLLDDLAARLQCQYVSNLKQPHLAHDLYETLLEIPAGRYPVREWEDALYYLVQIREPCPVPAEKVRKHLLDYLEHSAPADPLMK